MIGKRGHRAFRCEFEEVVCFGVLNEAGRFLCGQQLLSGRNEIGQVNHLEEDRERV